VVAPRIIASAVYVTGSSALEAGRRYVIAVHGSRLRFMGPIDVDPSVVSVDRPIAGANATALEGRLVISAPEGRSDMVVAFMSVAGTTPDALARAIVDAARASGGP
jgi:phage terminase large subunit-like protein